jgi:hypothetical protein
MKNVVQLWRKRSLALYLMMWKMIWIRELPYLSRKLDETCHLEVLEIPRFQKRGIEV